MEKLLLLVMLSPIIIAVLYGIYSVVRFVQDGKAAKREGRGRNPSVTKKFAISMTVLVFISGLITAMCLEAGWIIQFVIPALSALSALVGSILFVKDGKAAKRENRSRNQNITVVFIVAITAVSLVAILFVLALLTSALVMSGM